MPDEPKTVTSPGASADADPLIHQAVVEFCIARRTLLIYPFSHDQVKRSLQRAYHSLTAALEPGPNIMLTVMKEVLGVNNRLLDSKCTAFSDLAVVLKQYQIAALTISKGLEFNEFVRFLRLMAAARDKIMSEGGIAAVAARNRLDHVKFRAVDYTKLRMTEESEIQRSSRRQRDGSLWQAFVSDLLSEQDPAQSNGGTASGITTDPLALAALLNQGKLRPLAAIDHYERAIADAAKSVTAPLPGTVQGLEFFQQMIRALNPELQKQFLATTFDRCAQSQDTADAGRVMYGLGADLIVRMLEQAGSDGKLISPSLMAFVNKVGYLDKSGDGIAAGGDHAADSSGGWTQSKVESLLTKEDYDTYVDSDYGRLLNELTFQEQEPAAVKGSRPAPWIDGMVAELSDNGICVHVARAMTRMMTASVDIAGYRDWARQVAYLLDDLLQVRAFGYLTELMGIVRAEAAGCDVQRSEIAGLLLSRFSDTQFVAKAIQAVREPGKDTSPEALKFLTTLGEPVVLEIYDSVEPARITDTEEGFIQILKSLSSPAIREALRRINDPRFSKFFQE